MDIALWIAAGLLAVAFAMAGLMKLSKPKEELHGSMAWTEDFSQSQIKAIGTVEVLGAIGLVVPPLVGVAEWLSPVAAVGLALTMVGAALTHIKRKEGGMVPVNLVLMALAVFVAWGRFGPEQF